VFEICGQPTVGSRRKRHAVAVGRSPQKAGSARWPVVHGRTRDGDSSDKLPVVGIADLVIKIRVAVNTTVGFWRHFPRDKCSSFTVPSSAVNVTCWNGTNLVRYALLPGYHCSIKV